MAEAKIDGIVTCYEVVGTGPPLLMYAPGGFDATIEKWRTLGIYARTKPLDHLSRHYACIVFDRRECGRSGGRVEAITWSSYVAQGKGLLDHLGIERAHLMGGCMGCAPVVAFAVQYPQIVSSMILWWPVGGPRYRIKGRKRFDEHLAFVDEEGLDGVVRLVQAERKAFGADPRGGPWASVIGHDAEFARSYVKHDPAKYRRIVADMAASLLDRDTAPGAEPEALMSRRTPALVVPGHDESHATSAARYLEECLPQSAYWDVPVESQGEENSSARLLSFLATSRETVVQ